MVSSFDPCDLVFYAVMAAFVVGGCYIVYSDVQEHRARAKADVAVNWLPVTQNFNAWVEKQGYHPVTSSFTRERYSHPNIPELRWKPAMCGAFREQGRPPYHYCCIIYPRPGTGCEIFPKSRQEWR